MNISLKGLLTQQEYDNRLNPNTRAIAKAVKTIKEHSAFKVGDYLICELMDENKSMNCMQMRSLNIAQKFLVVCIDEYGLLFCKRVYEKGFAAVIECITTWDPSTYHFVSDNDYIDHLLLNVSDPYNPFLKIEKYIQKKKWITAKNKRLMFNAANANKMNEIIANFRNGDNIWKGSSSIKKRPIRLTIIATKNVSIPKKQDKYSDMWYVNKKIKEYWVVEAVDDYGNYYSLSTRNFIEEIIYNAKPISHDDY